MQLRRLELVGFKTFVDRTELDFHPGITAFVGPNGSGKSNIFDGIRWALGETNARLLRGARMDDVIFAGSASRRATGMATVALTLDNQQGLLPLTFTEVTVTRGVTRGGEGRYAINGVDCRLRDVQMLFLGTGLGGRSYALIGQGEVDAALRATPLERRRWLEEAAGLARQKRQRTEAERRLDHAAVHLNRLTDLADELEARQVTLAEQAEAARLHRSYSEAVADLEIALVADEARRLLTSARRLEGQLEADRDAVAAAETRVHTLTTAAAELDAALAAATISWEALQQALVDGAETLRVRSAEAQALEAEAAALRAQIEHATGELDRLAAERDRHAIDAGVLERELADVRRQRTALLDALEVAEAELAQAVADADQAEADLTEARTEGLEAARAHAQARADLAALQARADLLGEAIAAARQKAEDLTTAASALARAQDAAQQACASGRAETRRADAALAAATRSLEACRADLAVAHEHVRSIELEEHRLRARLASLEEAQVQFLGFEEGVRHLLLEARAEPARVPGLRGALADLIEVPSPYQAAVAVALGRRLHGLLVDDRASAEAVVRLLEDARRGGGVVLAADALQARAGGLTFAAPEIVARASDVVAAAPSAREAVAALLGDVAIVADLPAAWRVFATGFSGELATLDGVLLSPDGAITVLGHANGVAAPLGRGQALAALRQALAAAEAERQAAERARADAMTRAEAAEEAVRAASAQRELATAALAERAQRLAQLEVEAVASAEARATLAVEIEARAVELAGVEQEILRRHADVADLEAVLRDLEAWVHDRQQTARRLMAERDARVSAASDRRIALVQIEATADALQARLDDRAAAMAQVAGRVATLEEAAAQVRSALDALADRRAAIAATCDRLTAEQRARREEVERLTAERVRLREALAARQADRVAAVEELHGAETALHRTEVRHAQTDAELVAAAARLQEQFGISLEEAARRRLETPREDARRHLEEIRSALAALGAVNLRAIDEHAALTERLRALRAQTDDLQAAGEALRAAVTHINGALRVRFRQTFEQVNREFGRLFQRLFEGGEGLLELVEDEGGGEPGLEVIAQLPGKTRRPLVALSGGERVLVALALIFAMLRVHPSPFCIFDEVEAALDDVNTRRFTTLLRELAAATQVLIITHNKGTMAAADVLYGVTMQEPGVSSLVSVRLVRTEPDGDGDRAPTGRSEVVARAPVALPAE